MSVASGTEATAQAVAATAPTSVVDYFISSAPSAAIQLFFAVLVIFFFLAGWTRLRKGTIRRRGSFDGAMQTARVRSEEHTSELQSLMRISYAVFCLKKKKTQNKHD